MGLGKETVAIKSVGLCVERGGSLTEIGDRSRIVPEILPSIGVKWVSNFRSNGSPTLRAV